MIFFRAAFILPSLLLGPTAHAKNDFISASINQMMEGKYCGLVTPEDVQAVHPACDLSPHRQASTPYFEIYETAVFQKSAEMQATKNGCLAEQIDQLVHDDRAFNIWFSNLYSAWVGSQKARIYNWNCQRVLRPNANEEKAYYQKHFAKVCENKEQRETLKDAEELFYQSVPVINSENLMKIMEKSRNDMFKVLVPPGVDIKKLTPEEKLELPTAPLTDKDIAEMDLSNGDLHGMYLENVKAQLKAELEKVSKERREDVKKLQKALKDGDIPQDMRDYLFDDGTVYQALKEQGALTSGSDGGITQGASCIVSRYEPRMLSTMGSFVFTAHVIGKGFGLAQQAYRGIKTFMGFGGSSAVAAASMETRASSFARTISRIKNITPSQVGIAGATIDASGEAIWRECLSDSTHLPKTAPLANEEVKRNVPSSFAYSKKNLKFEVDLPACQSAQTQDLIVSSFQQAGCSQELLMAGPISVALPTMIFGK